RARGVGAETTIGHLQVYTPKGLYISAGGRAAHPRHPRHPSPYPFGVASRTRCNPFGVDGMIWTSLSGSALRDPRHARRPSPYPEGVASRTRCNPFGVDGMIWTSLYGSALRDPRLRYTSPSG